jgi:hypothetical protein
VAALFLDLTWFAAKRHSHTSKGYAVQLAADTCSCAPYYISPTYLHLSKNGSVTLGPNSAIHASNTGDMTVGPLAVEASKLPSMLSETYAVRAERILYLSADSDVAFQTIADMIDVTQNLYFPHEPATRMNIQVRLITKDATDRNCRAECFNWVKEPLVVHQLRQED